MAVGGHECAVAFCAATRLGELKNRDVWWDEAAEEVGLKSFGADGYYDVYCSCQKCVRYISRKAFYIPENSAAM